MPTTTTKITVRKTTAKPISFKVFGSRTKAKVSTSEKLYRGKVIAAAGPSRITVEIEVDDDHGIRKGDPVFLVQDSETLLDEMAARLTEEQVAECRALLRKHGAQTGAMVLTQDLLKRRRRLARKGS
jgi:hypothetical protein